jgi:hypothetical protein
LTKKYKGFTITAAKCKRLKAVFFSVHRLSDGWELASDNSPVGVRATVRDCQSMVDGYLVNPKEFE